MKKGDMVKSKEMEEKGRKMGGTGLNDLFIGVFGVAFLVSLSLNILHMTGYLYHEHESPVHESIKNFQSYENVKKENQDLEDHHQGKNGDIRLGHLNCDAFGGPSEELAREMIYWKDIPEDATWVSPFHDDTQTKYLTFEPDGGGWNNIRMAMETVFALALAMGRTLVIPPEKSMYLLGKRDNKQKKHFSFIDFYPIDDIATEYVGLKIISSKWGYLNSTNKQRRGLSTKTVFLPSTFVFPFFSVKEYLETEAMTGRLRNKVCIWLGDAGLK